MTACVCKRHDPPTAVLAVLELSLLWRESCTSGRGTEPIYDHFGHAGQLKLLLWVLDNCWLALACGVSSVLAYGVANVICPCPHVLLMLWYLNTVQSSYWSMCGELEHMGTACSKA